MLPGLRQRKTFFAGSRGQIGAVKVISGFTAKKRPGGLSARPFLEHTIHQAKLQPPLLHSNRYFSKSFAYFPYPSFIKSSFGMNLRAAEFMQ